MAGTRALLGVCAMALCSCASPPPPAPLPSEPPPFAGSSAWGHLEALVGMGSRAPGSEGAARAREYVRDQLETLGLEVSEQHFAIEDRGDGVPVDVTNIVGVVPGESSDLFVLAARLDTRSFETFEHTGAAAASGAALLLELATALVSEPLPYTTRLVFLGAETAQGELPESHAFWSSRLLVNELADEGVLDRVRLAVYFGQVADAELTIARDLVSHRTYRDAFFKAARRMGHDGLFPSSMGFDAIGSGHSAFLAARMRRVVIITDPRYGGDQPPGIYHHTEQDTLERLSPENLAAVGRVSERALRDISVLLVRVDRFARRRSVDESSTEPSQLLDAEPSGADSGLVEPTEASSGEEPAEEAGPGEAPEPGQDESPPEPAKVVESSTAPADETLQEAAPEESPR